MEKKMDRFREQASELVKGAYDLHTHTTPSHFPRSLDDFTLLREADKVGLAGVMLKNHYEPTAGRAVIANLCAGTKAKAYGSIALNWSVGGLNPYAVEACLKMGGKMVWMPTFDSGQFLSYGPVPGGFLTCPGITIFDDGGKIIPAVYEIFEVVRKYDVCLATGHLSPEESLALCKAGTDAKVRMILTHPEFKQTKIPLDMQLTLADMGVIIEKVWLNAIWKYATVEEMAGSIKKIGSYRVFLTTDRGQENAEYPPQAMIEAVAAMLEKGLSPADIENLIKTTPRNILKI
jgi:hypothetical protein